MRKDVLDDGVDSGAASVGRDVNSERWRDPEQGWKSCAKKLELKADPVVVPLPGHLWLRHSPCRNNFLEVV